MVRDTHVKTIEQLVSKRRNQTTRGLLFVTSYTTWTRGANARIEPIANVAGVLSNRIFTTTMQTHLPWTYDLRFFDMKVAFRPADRAVLCCCHSVYDEPEKYISLFFDPSLQTLEAELLFDAIFHWSPSRKGSLSELFSITVSYQFLIEMIAGVTLFSCENSGIDINSSSKFSDIVHTDDTVLLSEDTDKLHAFLNHLNDNLPIFGLHLAHSKCSD